MNVALGRWRTLFLVEPVLVAGTLVYWVVAPASYLHDVLGVATPDANVIHLLMLYAGTVGSLVFWAYARLLLRPEVHLPSFRIFQEGLLIGDVGIVATSAGMIAEGTRSPAIAAQLGMAALWGLVRVVFLLWTRVSAAGAPS